jgi:hypothetical protein
MSDSVRLLSRVTQAFVDRAPIDWNALLSRTTGTPERDFVGNLRLLDSIRNAPATVQATETRRDLYPVWALLGAAIIQVTLSLAILTAALVTDRTPSDRPAQFVLMCAFTAASGLLSTTWRDARSVCLLAWLATAASLFARSAVHGLPEMWFSSFDGLFRGVELEAFAPACLWRFAQEFPRVQRFTRFDALARRATSIAWLFGLTLFGINLLGTYHPIDKSPFNYLLRDNQGSVFWRVLTLTLVPAVGTILVRSRRAPLPERQKVARFSAAIAVGMAPFLLLGVVATISPAFNAWLPAASAAEHLWIDVAVIGGLTALPLMTSAAVIIDRPFELHAMLRRASLYAVGRSLLGVVAAVPFAAMFVTLYQQRRGSIEDVFSSSLAVPLLAYGTTGALLLATRSRMLKAFDRYVSRRAVEHHKQLARTLERIRLARGTREVIAVLEPELQQGTGAQTVRALLQHPSGFAAASGLPTPLPVHSAIATVLGETTGALDVSINSELRALLPADDREWVTGNEVALIAALKRRDETIAALVVLGPKHGGVPFDSSDHWLITTLTSAAAAAWADDDTAGGHSTHRDQHAGEDEAAFECPRCRVVSDSATLPCKCRVPAILAAMPAHLGNAFVVHRRLGSGGMGVVYLARDTVLDRDVALKTLPELTPGAVARLRDEARAMAALNHETLATIYGLELWRRTPVLVVEYLPKGTLARKLIEGPLSTGETIDLGIRVVRALASMHARGLLHRDLKPSNVGFTATGLPKLLDFGLAVLTEPASVSRQREDGEESRPAPPAGTPAYLPPEAYRGATAGPAFDLWALSVVLLEAISGSNPFAGASRVGTSHRVGTLHRPDLSVHLRTFSIDLSTFFERALDRNPEARFRSASQMLSALERLASR